MRNILIKSNLGEERVYLADKSQPQSIMKGSQDRSSGQELGVEDESRDHGRPLLTGLLCPLSDITQDSLSMGSAIHRDWAFPNQSLIEAPKDFRPI